MTSPQRSDGPPWAGARRAVYAARVRVRLAAASLLFGLGCGPAATGLGTEQPLLAEVKGTLVGNLLALGPRTRVGLVWTGVPVFVPYCHEYGYTPLDRERAVTTEAALGCRSPFAVVSSVVGPSVPLESTGDGTFTIPLRQVPPASVMVGEPGRRVAYASVVLFVDDDGDGELDLGRPCGGGGGGLGGGPPVGSTDAGVGVDAAATTDDTRAGGEVIMGATFSVLTRPQIRITYVEGALDQSSYWYPPPAGCSSFPSAGFSAWRMGSSLDPSATCEVERLEDATIGISIAERDSLGDVNGLRCTQGARQTFPRELSARTAESLAEGFDRYSMSCLDDGTVVLVDKRCACREVRTYPLAGCRDEVDCPVPEWDLRASPPQWWPCAVRRGP